MIDIMETEKMTELNFNFEQKKESTGTMPLFSGYSEQDATKNTNVIVMLVQNQSFKSDKKTYELSICGKPMKDYVLDKVKDFSHIQAELDSDADFLAVAKQNLNDKKYTLILFSDAPLITKKTIKEVIEYFVMKNLSVLKFTRGYMFETNYLKTIDKLLSPQIQYFEEEDFITCYNPKQYSLICDIMKNRIITYHQKNGVIFEDAVTTQVDADASIENDVIVGSNCQIKGKSIIESGAKLKNNCYIENSLIKKDSQISSSIIKDSIVGENCIVENFAVIENKSIIGDNSKLCGYNHIDCCILPKNSLLEFYERKER